MTAYNKVAAAPRPTVRDPNGFGARASHHNPVRLNLDSARDSDEALKTIQGLAQRHLGDRPLHLQVRATDGQSITLVPVRFGIMEARRYV